MWVTLPVVILAHLQDLMVVVVPMIAIMTVVIIVAGSQVNKLEKHSLSKWVLFLLNRVARNS